MAKRLTLWEESRFEDLLRRAEEQLLILRRAGKRRKCDAQPDPLARADRARRTAAVAAYREATTGLVSSMLSFEEQEDLTWAKELLPISTFGSASLQRPGAGTSSTFPLSEDWDRPFAGLHCAALAAPGPTGSRAEHVTDMPSVPRRIHANKLHAALSAVFCRISAGTLPPAARRLTRTRLCWQRKKSGKPRPIKMGERLRLVNQRRVAFAPRSCACISGASACQVPVTVTATGGAPLKSPWRPTARLNRLSRPTWIWSTFFGNAEWPCIREALRTHFPEAAAWTEWQHQADSVTTFSTRATFATNRGAEQRDVLGTLHGALVLGKRALFTLGSSSPIPLMTRASAMNGSSMTGRCSLVLFSLIPSYVPWTEPTSRAPRLLCPPERQHEVQGWDTPYVQDIVDVLAPEAHQRTSVGISASFRRDALRDWQR